MGIIDILQEYNMKKTAEYGFKGITIDFNTISSVPPGKYAQRFYRFVDNMTR